jgi:hypothetical protein
MPLAGPAGDVLGEPSGNFGNGNKDELFVEGAGSGLFSFATG